MTTLLEATEGYADLIERKRIRHTPTGFDLAEDDLNLQLFDWQRRVVSWALKRGRAAIFADCGLGKTPMQLEWAQHVSNFTGSPVLILAPLAVAAQTAREGDKFGVPVTVCRSQADVVHGVNVTNYEMLAHFDPSAFGGLVLDESSILKSYTGTTRNAIQAFADKVAFRLACTATPAPNDVMEMTNHSEFVGSLQGKQVLALFMQVDYKDGSQGKQSYILKPRARRAYFEWLASWAIALRRPSDAGGLDEGFELPPLEVEDLIVDGADTLPSEGQLFALEASTLQERNHARRHSIDERVAQLAERIHAEPWEPWIVWCGLNDESRAATLAIDGAVEVTGSDTPAWKEAVARWFNGEECLCHLPRSGVSTTAHGSKRTGNMSAPTARRPKTNGTPDDESFTRSSQSAAANASVNPKPGAGATLRQTLPNDSDALASPRASTARSSSRSAVGAQSAGALSRLTTQSEHGQADGDSTSTTATTPGSCEESSARPATSDLESSEMTPASSSGRPCTCGHESGSRVLVSKSSIFGWGMNWQHCARAAFLGLSDSWEQYYQAVRRNYRFGQLRAVRVVRITAANEGAVLANIERKERQAAEMMDGMVDAMGELTFGRNREPVAVRRDTRIGEGWQMHLGDSVQVLDEFDDGAADMALFSPPFPGMYMYTDTPFDIGNTSSMEEMIEHFRFVAAKLRRVVKPGRLCCVHLMQLPAYGTRDGFQGIIDYRGKVISMMMEEGWRYASEVTIDKDPQRQARAHKEHGLLYKTLATDSTRNRQALADYLLVFRNRGENAEPVRSGIHAKYQPDGGWITQDEWIEWAAPVWYRHLAGIPGGIRETDVLQRCGPNEERHLCPLQQGVIERAVKLWSNPGDVVLSPFGGIASEGVGALRFGRQFLGVELNEAYWQQACRNLETAANPTLMDESVPA